MITATQKAFNLATGGHPNMSDAVDAVARDMAAIVDRVVGAYPNASISNISHHWAATPDGLFAASLFFVVETNAS